MNLGTGPAKNYPSWDKLYLPFATRTHPVPQATFTIGPFITRAELNKAVLAVKWTIGSLSRLLAVHLTEQVLCKGLLMFVEIWIYLQLNLYLECYQEC